MRIVHVSDTMHIGGAEMIIASLCRMQREAGHVPSVECLESLGSIGERLRLEGFQVNVHAKLVNGVIPRGFNYGVGLMGRLARSLRTSRPDAVHCHNSTATIMAAIPAWLSGARAVISTRHGLVAPPYDRKCELKFAFATRFCTAIVGVCRATSINLRGAPFAAQARIVTVYNGAAPASEGQMQPKRSGFTLVHVARLSPLKDQSTLIEAVALARREVPDLALWIVGDGPLSAQLRDRTKKLGITDIVKFMGAQTAVRPYLRAADAFILSSVSEGLPMALLEAMAEGMACIVTDVGGMGEVVAQFEAGIVVPKSDPAKLARAIVQTAATREVSTQARQNARAAYLSHFTPARMHEAYVRLYSGLSPEDQAIP